MNTEKSIELAEKLESFSKLIDKYVAEIDKLEKSNANMDTISHTFSTLKESLDQISISSNEYVTKVSDFINTELTPSLDKCCSSIKEQVDKSISTNEEKIESITTSINNQIDEIRTANAQNISSSNELKEKIEQLNLKIDAISNKQFKYSKILMIICSSSIVMSLISIVLSLA